MFNEAFEIVVGHEGGYQNLHHDRGNWTSGIVGVGINKGTKYGVAAHAYPNLDIKNLTLEQARKIYRENYWDKIGADKMAPPLALAAFDLAINSGVGTALRLLRGVTSYQQLCAHRRDFVRALAAQNANYGKFLRGWLIRIDTIEKQCATFGAATVPALAQKPAAPQGRTFIRENGRTVEFDGAPLLLAGAWRVSTFDDGAVLIARVGN